MKTMIWGAALLAATTCLASAADFKAEQIGFTGGNVITVGTLGTFRGGLIEYAYGEGGSAAGKAAGQFVGNEGGRFVTFCIELEQTAQSSMRDYTITSLALAPTPSGGQFNPNAPGPYGSAVAVRINEVVAAAVSQGWINSDLSLGTANTNQLIGIQAAIWDAIYGPNVVTVSIEAAQTAMITLTDTYGSGARVKGLAAAISANSQDILYVVPLPPAAFAGLATLFGVAGVARLRRR
jgi:hypothetical protein